jgi:hypothetical protein
LKIETEKKELERLRLEKVIEEIKSQLLEATKNLEKTVLSLEE